MKQTTETTAPFAFRLADAQDKPQQAQWQVRNDVAVAAAGCSGRDARASKTLGWDNGMWC